MRRELVLLLAAPLLAYPLLAASLLITDAIVGERLLSFYARYGRGQLVQTFASDYVAAVPGLYVGVAMLGSGVGLVGRVRRRSVSFLMVLVVFAAAGWAVAVFLTGRPAGASHPAFAVAGLGTAVPVGIALARWSRRWAHVEDLS